MKHLRSLFSLALLAGALTLVTGGCTDKGGASSASLVVGITGDDVSATIDELHVIAKLNGATVKDERIKRGASGLLAFPIEILLEGEANAPVEVSVEGMAPQLRGGSSQPVLRRLATTRLATGPRKLLRVGLDSRCLDFGAAHTHGGPLPLTCAPSETCVAGRCVPAAVAPEALEPYAAGWPANAPDVCRPAGGGKPELILGKGQTDFSTLQPGETLQMELGPQGGHHIWLAIRMRNLRQAGTRTALSAVQPDGGLKASPTAFVFTFDTDEGGYCKLFGLRFQLDAGGDLGTTYKGFLGKPLDVTVEVTDPAGQKATATQRVLIAPKLLCPDGTDKCNTP